MLEVLCKEYPIDIDMLGYSCPVVLDIGAYIGSFSFAVIAKSPNVVCHAFEPQMETAHKLRKRRNKKGIKGDQLFVHKTAVTAQQEEETVFFQFDKRPQSSSLIKRLDKGKPPARIKVPSISFSQLLTIHEPDYVKVNVEGAEWGYVWSTPPEILAKMKQFTIGFHPELGGKRPIQEAQALLEAAGFDVTYRTHHSGKRRPQLYGVRK